MNLSIEQFYMELVDSVQRYLPDAGLDVNEINMLRLKVRIPIAISFFIDVFYAFRTYKISFAVIRKGERIFGIDNLGSWHSHPFGRPEDHIQISEPSIEKMVMECSGVIKEFAKEL